jgi:ABC-2 type transport system permease protein
MLARYLLACAAALLPLCVFAAATGAWSGQLLVVALAIALYAAVWTCICAWISLRGRAAASAANAMRMLALWAAVTIALPALANSLLALRAPMAQGGKIALSHRKVVSDAWDLPKETTFEAFFRWHPEWRDTPPVTGRFHWKWYYAFHHVADRSVDPQVRALEATMRDRDRYAAMLGLALPPVAMQNILDGLADNGNARLLAHRAAVRDFHDRLRLYFYPYLFEQGESGASSSEGRAVGKRVSQARTFNAADFAGMPSPLAAPATVRYQPAAWLGLLVSLLLIAMSLRRQMRRADGHGAF